MNTITKTLLLNRVANKYKSDIKKYAEKDKKLLNEPYVESGRYKMKNKRVLSILIFISIIIIICENAPTAYCGLEEMRPSLTQLVGDMNDIQLAELVYHLRLNPQNLVNELAVPVDIMNQLQNNVNPENLEEDSVINNRLDSVFIFLVGTVILFGFALYRENIMNFLFDIVNNMPNVIERSYLNIITLAAEAGQGHIMREVVINQTQEMLNDPEKAAQVVNAFRAIGRPI
jgi:hypothetical protein